MASIQHLSSAFCIPAEQSNGYLEPEDAAEYLGCPIAGRHPGEWQQAVVHVTKGAAWSHLHIPFNTMLGLSSHPRGLSTEP